jgi:hypothetical protein
MGVRFSFQFDFSMRSCDSGTFNSIWLFQHCADPQKCPRGLCPIYCPCPGVRHDATLVSSILTIRNRAFGLRVSEVIRDRSRRSGILVIMGLIWSHNDSVQASAEDPKSRELPDLP